MTTEILFKFAKEDINLSPEAYSLINSLDDPLNFSSFLIIKLKSQKFSKEVSLSLDSKTVENLMKITELSTSNKKNNKNLSFNSQKILPNDEKINRVIDINSNDYNDIHNSGFGGVCIEKDTGDTKIDSNVYLKNSHYTSDGKSSIEDNNLDCNHNDKFRSQGSLMDNKTIIKENIPNDYKIDKKIFLPCKYRRNLGSFEENHDYKVIQDTTNKSYTCGEIGDLITYFQDRYSKLSGILSKRAELKTCQKISDLKERTIDLNLIVMVKKIRDTMKGHRIITFEDDTAEINVFFSKYHHKIFKKSEKLVKDEVLGLLAKRHGDLNIANRIIQPGVPRIPKKTMDFSLVFTSDIHIGSLTFLEDAFVKFIKWLNGDYGTEEQRAMGSDVKYLIVGGDIVDGIGIYPNQDKELSIKDIRDQYEESAKFFGDIRNDIKIVISPGNHDASRVAEPQPAIPKKYAKSLYELNNIEFVSNPAVISLDGWNILIYHGRSFDDIAITGNGFSYEKNDIIMEELLKKRHLAPIYGDRTPLASEIEDHLVICNVPDIFHTGHVHINSYKNYNNIHLINSGTFQAQTEFQKTHNIFPTCAEVPILHRGVYKKLNFS